jgi:hypothetical protein
MEKSLNFSFTIRTIQLYYFCIIKQLKASTYLIFWLKYEQTIKKLNLKVILEFYCFIKLNIRNYLQNILFVNT